MCFSRRCLRLERRLLPLPSGSYFKGRPASTSFPEKSQTKDPPAENAKKPVKTIAQIDEELRAEMDNTVKTIAQLDEELRLKMEDKSGEGGEAGIELEDGKPTAMKRGVRENMFRVI